MEVHAAGRRAWSNCYGLRLVSGEATLLAA
jgi:hypothetical protein